MKKIISRLGVLLTATVLLSSCNFLDVEEYYGGGNWSAQADFEQAIVELYAYQYDNWAEEVTGTGLFSWEISSDDILMGRTGYPHEAQIHDMKWSAVDRGEISCIWWRMYLQNTKANNIIRDINYAFENGLEFDMDEEFRKLAIAEARFARAYAMLWIAPYYGDDDSNGGIPIILETTPVDAIDSPRPASVLENYDQIISDFRLAAEDLPFFSEIVADNWHGRAHKSAAWGLAARAALYAAQYDDSYYATVIEMCDNIIKIDEKAGATAVDKRALVTTPGTYVNGDVRPAYGNLFTMANNYSSEYIWSFVGNTKSATAGPQFYAQGMNNGGWGYANTWGKFQPTWELYMAYETGDERREATILKPGDKASWFGEELHVGARSVLVNDKESAGKQAGDIQQWDISSTTGLLFRKYMEPFEYKDADDLGYINCNASRPRTAMGQVVLRYADILLMKAEALIKTKGEGDAEAIAYINEVRTRAGLPADSNGTLAQLKQERRVEFAYEFQPSRMLDLIRWGDAKDVYNNPTHGCNYTVTYADDNDMGTVVIDYNNPVKMFDAREFDPTVNHVTPIPNRAFNGTLYLKQNNGY